MRDAAGRIFHSATLLVAREGQVLLHEAHGRSRLDTAYDLASLTKPLATTAAAMLLTAEGQLSPDDRLAALLPEAERRHLRDLRLWHLLAHAAGLPAWRPFYQRVEHLPAARRRGAVRRLVAATPLQTAPGREAIYSDLGFILLDWAIERRAGERLDRLLARRLCRPLGLSRTFFIDLHRRRPPATAIAPTERCPWRGRRLVGEVHDENCAAMGGISGHAGLFATAYDVHLLARELAAAYHGGRSIFDRQVVRRYLLARPLRGSTRALGWDTPSASGSSSGRCFGVRSVGHLGFTGTSLWIDLERALWVVLLTNRVYYGREPNLLRPFRPRLHDAVAQALR
jgi:serine-type D-Ala-D-Ala carboxypeptidase